MNLKSLLKIYLSQLDKDKEKNLYYLSDKKIFIVAQNYNDALFFYTMYCLINEQETDSMTLYNFSLIKENVREFNSADIFSINILPFLESDEYEK